MNQKLYPVHVYAEFADLLAEPARAAFTDREIVFLKDQQSFAAEIGEMVHLLTLDPPQDYWDQATSLRLLQGFGAGIERMMPLINLPAQVQVANAGGLVTKPMAEFALGLSLMMVKGIGGAVSAQRTNSWQPFTPGQAAGSTLAILGLGKIGQELARMASYIGFDVTGMQRTPKHSKNVRRIYAEAETKMCLGEADVVLSLLPHTAKTEGFMNTEMFLAMRPGSTFINLGRGATVDEVALVECLHSGHLAAAALDVFAEEPLPEDSPLWGAPNLILTPHISGLYNNYIPDLMYLFAENVRRVERGMPVATPVNVVSGY